MATISKSWGSEATIMNAVAVTTGSYSSDVDLETNGYEGAHITISAAFSTTDDLVIEIEGSLDGIGYDSDLYGLSALTMPHTDSVTRQISFVVKDVAHFRLYCKRSGSTDTITVTAKVQPWRWTSA